MDLLNGPPLLNLFRFKTPSDPGDPDFAKLEFKGAYGTLPHVIRRVKSGDLQYSLCLPEDYSLVLLRAPVNRPFTGLYWRSGFYHAGGYGYDAMQLTYRGPVPTGGFFKWKDSKRIPYNATAQELSAACDQDPDLSKYIFTGGPLDKSPIFVMRLGGMSNSMSELRETERYFQYYFDDPSGIYVHEGVTRLATGDTAKRDPAKLVLNEDKIVAGFATPSPAAKSLVNEYNKTGGETNSTFKVTINIRGQGLRREENTGTLGLGFSGVYAPPVYRGTYKIKGTLTLKILKTSNYSPNIGIGGRAVYFPTTFDGVTPFGRFTTDDIPVDALPMEVLEKVAAAIETSTYADVLYYDYDGTNSRTIPFGAVACPVDRSSMTFSDGSFEDGFSISFYISARTANYTTAFPGASTSANYRLYPDSMSGVHIDTAKLTPPNITIYDRKLNRIEDKRIGLNLVDLKVVGGKYKTVVASEDSYPSVRFSAPISNAGTTRYHFGINPNDPDQTFYIPLGYMVCETYEGTFPPDYDPDNPNLVYLQREPTATRVENVSMPAPYTPTSGLGFVTRPTHWYEPEDNPFNRPRSGIYWMVDGLNKKVALNSRFEYPGPETYEGAHKDIVKFVHAGNTQYMHDRWWNGEFQPNEFFDHRDAIPEEYRLIGGTGGETFPLVPPQGIWRTGRPPEPGYATSYAGDALWGYTGVGEDGINLNFGGPGAHQLQNGFRDRWSFIQHAMWAVYIPQWVEYTSSPSVKQSSVTYGNIPKLEFRAYDENWNLETTAPIPGNPPTGDPLSFLGLAGNSHLPQYVYNPLGSPNIFNKYPCLGFKENTVYKWSDGTYSLFEKVSEQTTNFKWVRRDANNNVVESADHPVPGARSTYYAESATAIVGPDDCLYTITTEPNFSNGETNWWLGKTDRNFIPIYRHDLWSLLEIPLGLSLSNYMYAVMAFCLDDKLNLYMLVGNPNGEMFVVKFDRNLQLVAGAGLLDGTRFGRYFSYKNRQLSYVGGQIHNGASIFNYPNHVFRMEYQDGEVQIYGPGIDVKKFATTQAALD